MPLALPRDLSTPGAAIDFLNRLPVYLSASRVTVDFGLLSFARPYATLVAAEGLRAFVKARQDRGLQTDVRSKGLFIGERQSAVSYLGHVGFFEYVGIEFGKLPGAASGGPTYLPLTVIKRVELEAEARGRVLQDAVLDKCQHLSEMIFADECQQDVLAYCLREIVRNVFEHAETDRCTLMAQKYWGDQVEIAIADSGRGIQSSLGGAYMTQLPLNALQDAIRPGVTRMTGPQSGTKWDNTGFGLYVVSRLGRETGTFSLASSGSLLTLSGRGTHAQDCPLSGTAIRLLVNVSEAEYFPNRLHRIVEEGEAEVALRGSGTPSASKGTRMSKSAP